MTEANAVAHDVLTVRREITPELAVVSAVGEIDLGTAPVLERELTEVVDAATTPTMVVADLSGVTFVGSTGLAVLTGCHGRCAERAVPFVVAVTDPAVRRILALTKLDHVLDVVDSIDGLPEPRQPSRPSTMDN
jgi:anti-sigma B factor antagonist